MNLRTLSLVLAVFSAPAAAEALSELDRLTSKVERNLDSTAKGYHCARFAPTESTDRDIREAANDARARGQHVFYCTAYPKDVSPSGKGMGSGGLVVFVTDDGMPQPAHWAHAKGGAL